MKENQCWHLSARVGGREGGREGGRTRTVG
jgi:hypothetical protein